LETQEGIGLNRFIEYGVPVTMKYTSHDSVSVDTELDRIEVEKLLNLLWLDLIEIERLYDKQIITYK
jgi:hypothetical protein